jgi:CheY-like chemotaxis protein
MEKTKDALPPKRILLVDDERLVRETIRLLLRAGGHTVVEANNGAEALGLFAREAFDLVVTDYEMPFVKGNELAARIKQKSPLQPILMITGHRREAGPGNPVDVILSKPFHFSKLQAAMAEALGRFEAEGVEPAVCECGLLN